MTTARLDRVPLAGAVLESPSPFGQIRAVLRVARAVIRLDQPEALFRQEAEGLGVMVPLITPVQAIPPRTSVRW